jgi:hypothetical protein
LSLVFAHENADQYPYEHAHEYTNGNADSDAAYSVIQTEG